MKFDIQKEIEALIWIKDKLNDLMKDEEDLGETDIANKLDAPITQLLITINSLELLNKENNHDEDSRMGEND